MTMDTILKDMDYEAIKALAKQCKKPVTKFLALAASNDPFYCGMPSQVEKATWFADLWSKFGYTSGVHIRRMHYQIVSQSPPVLMVNSKPYENTEACWHELNTASHAARYLDMVNPEHFVDRRNAAPVDNIDYETDLHAIPYATGYDVDDTLFTLPDFPPTPRLYSFVASPQRYHVEMWCEKSTQDDILRPLAVDYGAALQYGLGELSITLAIEALRRFEKSNKPVRIFYISDFDPSGRNMPRSMAVKLQKYNVKLGLHLDIKLFPLILTPEQVKAYNLPRTPIKDTDKRKDTFELRFGVGATELDALEALYPGELRSILVQELNRYYDHDLKDAVYQYEHELDTRLEALSADVRIPYEAIIGTFKNEWQAIRARYEQEIASHLQQRRSVWQAIHADLQQAIPQLESEDVPQADHADESEGALFDSSRDYLTQNAIYQAHKGNEDEE